MLTPKDEKYFAELLELTRSDLCKRLPPLDDPDIFQAACRSVQDAQVAFDTSKKARDGADTEHKQSAQDAMDAAEQALGSACEVALTAAKPLIQHVPILDDDSWDDALALCTVLVEATPKGLADYCARGSLQDELMDQLLSDAALMKEFLKAGGVRAGCYGDAMEIYTKLLSSGPTTSSSMTMEYAVLHALAVAVSVELADGSLQEFDTEVPVDPIARFHHYQHACECGELDSAFATFSTFELRYVINSNAPNDQLAWGRDMLRNYRPDQIYMDDMAWRYVMSVRTDVPYKHPTWTGTPRTYPMIISGGGECGPRAWFGRFMLQAFGIPNWGVRQPGHAALTHWTPDGWVVCLGATWKFCTWEGRWGPDFLLETQARARGETKYMSVLRLEWFGNVVREPLLDHGKCIVNSDSLWRSLALMQKTILSKEDVKLTITETPIQRIQSPPAAVPLSHVSPMVVEATSCRKPEKSTSNDIFMKSFLGGMQLHHQGGDTVEYAVDIEETATYSMTVMVVTVHRDCENTPMLLTLDQDDTTSISTVQIPYTMGAWQETQPVLLELKKGVNIMSFARQTPNSGLTLKSFLFRPLT